MPSFEVYPPLVGVKTTAGVSMHALTAAFSTVMSSLEVESYSQLSAKRMVGLADAKMAVPGE